MEYRNSSSSDLMGANSNVQVVLTAIPSSTDMKSVSTYQTQPSASADSVEWNEQAILGGFRGDDSGLLLVSVIHKATGGAVTVQGQELIALKSYPLLHIYQPIDINVRLKQYAYHIRDSDHHNIYNEIVTKRVTEEDHHISEGKGILLMSISLCPFAYSMCGWIERLSHEMLTYKWKKRWFILCDMVLYYYDDPNDVSTLKGALDLSTVVSITEQNKKGDICYELSGKTTSNEEAVWSVRFLDNDTNKVKEMWKRKISRSCHYITGSNAFPSDKDRRHQGVGDRNASMLGSFELTRTKSGHTTEHHSVNAVRRMSYATAGIGSGSFHKGGVSKKRASIFGL